MKKCARFLAVCALLAAGALWLFAQFCTLPSVPLTKADTIIVLGTRANEDGTLSPGLASRMDEAIRLWKARLAPTIIVTGSAVANKQIEALAMANYAMEHGVPKQAITIEPIARDTRENAAYSVRIMQEKHLKSAIIVTSNFHSRRAKMLFDAHPIQTQYAPVPYPDEMNFLEILHALLHEGGGYAKLFYITWASAAKSA